MLWGTDMNAEQQGNCACLSVVMPCYNEELTLCEVVTKVLKVPHLLEVIIVDDCSSDRTAEIAQQLVQDFPLIRYVRHSENAGKT